MSLRKLPIAAFLIASLATPAFAHTGHDLAFTPLAGLLHPLTGADHLAAMLLVGMWAALIGGRRLWVWPAAFVTAMLAGAVAGRSGLDVPAIEPLIAGSVILLGLAIAVSLRVPVVLGAMAIAAFGLVHGFAHGAEAPANDFGGYVAGVLVATAALHGIGLAAATAAVSRIGARPVRAVGALGAGLGLALLVA